MPEAKRSFQRQRIYWIAYKYIFQQILKELIQKIEGFLLNHPLWLMTLAWLKKTSPVGFAGIPLYNIIVFIRDELQKDDLVTRANSMAFSFFLALFPAIIVLFTLLAYTPLYLNFSSVLKEYIAEVMPGNAGAMVFSTIEDIVTIERRGLLSFGFLLAIWFSSNGMLSMMTGFEKEYRTTFRKRSPFEKRLIAIELTFLIFVVLVASVTFVILGNIILDYVYQYIQYDWFTHYSFFLFRMIVVCMLFYSSISTIYRFGVSSRRKIRFVSPGSILATVLSLLTSFGFSFYIDNFGSYNKIYGSIGTLIVLMVWLQLNCSILLIGFELNASIAVLRDKRRAKKAEEKVLHRT